MSRRGSAPRADEPPSTGGRSGILPAQCIRALIDDRDISASEEIGDDQIQPASLDLRLGRTAYRIRASFLPGDATRVEDKIRAFEMHRIDLSKGAVLERGCVYIVPLCERLALPPALSAIANPKSSIGRLDVFTRVIADGTRQFNVIADGYRGPLYAEIAPRTFSILVRRGSRLNQMRLRVGAAAPVDLRPLHEQVGLVDRALALDGRNGLLVRLDLDGDPENGPIGYRARQNGGVIDVDCIAHYDPLDFWEPIRTRGGGIILNPDDFHILSTRESITVPPDHAAEMIAYDTQMGEFRVHYAGFFDPGFGHVGTGGHGSRAVLEVRSHDVPFLLEHEQIIGRLRYERLLARPDRVYGPAIGSAYQGQGLALSKQFGSWPPCPGA